ncbi:uncharacterized protein H6S33_005276 [Morchella sextelata]|uniref:uncharacterized protein n=1 Tax=Morchella sextelata TaxID=1174677 RepID=UPI001D04B66E|nr:uncharacterized protein H6S33_005276 [Morchella sextelata]KAH0605294.1 hypothetical protein H6S33_005276 [Morchella sextelata]
MPTHAAPGPPPRPTSRSPYIFFTCTISPTSPLLPPIPTPVANRHPYDQLIDPRTDSKTPTSRPSTGSTSPRTRLRPPVLRLAPHHRRHHRHGNAAAADAAAAQTQAPAAPPSAAINLPATDYRPIYSALTHPSDLPQLMTTASLMSREPLVPPEMLQPTSPQQPARRITCPHTTKAKSAAWGWGWVSMRTPVAAAVLSPERSWRTARPVLQVR